MTPYEFVAVACILIVGMQSAIVWIARPISNERAHALAAELVTLVLFAWMYVFDLAPSRSALMF